MLEGGGQILRNAAALSAITRTPILVHSIRAGRDNPGLRPQHLTGLQLIESVCSGRLRGGAVGSKRVALVPGKLRCADFVGDTRTAGSCMLLAQVGWGRAGRVAGVRGGSIMRPAGCLGERGCAKQQVYASLPCPMLLLTRHESPSTSCIQLPCRLLPSPQTAVPSLLFAAPGAGGSTVSHLELRGGGLVGLLAVERKGVGRCRRRRHACCIRQCKEGQGQRRGRSLPLQEALLLQSPAPHCLPARSLPCAALPGTDAAMAPPVGYMQHVLLPILERQLGLGLEMQLERRGFFPKVGGKCEAQSWYGGRDTLLLLGMAIFSRVFRRWQRSGSRCLRGSQQRCHHPSCPREPRLLTLMPAHPPTHMPHTCRAAALCA